jgi:hypothetical protein
VRYQYGQGGRECSSVLNKYTFGSGGKDPLDFKEPRAFREKIADLTGTNPFFAITWSGRGRMPLRIVDGIEYATLWTADVSLPATLVSIDGPEKEYSSFIRSARLSDVLAAVKTQIAQNSHKAGAQGR